MIKIDQARCQGCGLCVKLCPTSSLGLDSGRSLLKAPERCIACGHCFAFCPAGAISQAGQTPGPTLLADQAIDQGQLELLIKSRRSIRAFRKDPVPRELIEKALELAAWAPAGGNIRIINWTIVQSPKRVQAIAKAVIDSMRAEVEQGTEASLFLNYQGLIAAWEQGGDPITRGAPHLALAHHPGSGKRILDGGMIATSTLDLALHGLGLGACWAGFLLLATNLSPILEDLGINPKDHLAGALIFGYPEHQAQRIPQRPLPRVEWR